jgi:glycosyltransferase involved in cell wall biosynthesis
MNLSQQPVISIIVPVFNAAGHLAKCIDSILAQTFTAFECILVDDGSTDDSLNICKKYADLDRRIKVLHQNNAGVSSARNTGLKNCTGEYVAFVDSDDMVLPEMYEVMYANITAGIYDFVCCGFKHKAEVYSASAIFGRQSQAKIVYLLEDAGLFGTVWNKLFKREIIEKNHIYFPEGYSFGEDFLYNLTYFSYVNTGICINNVLYEYNSSEMSVSKNRPNLDQSLFRFKNVNKQIFSLRENSIEQFRNRILALDFTYSIFLIRNIAHIHNRNERLALLSEVKSFYQENKALYSFRSFRYCFFYLLFMFTPLYFFEPVIFHFFHLVFFTRKYI